MASREDALAARRWFIVDADSRIVGRIATQVANVLRGKHKPTFTPHVDTGDFVVVVNASKVRLTGAKLTDKIYHRHTGYPGGVRRTSAERLMNERPERILRSAIVGMLPKNRLGRRLATKLKIYRGAEHPHEAQKPEALSL
ncbi:MAG: 50S ribosomal protein L13 [Proteobacteria bacterium]|nr:50S ribosomal protein L13 [Pseudomonadota bacterium]